MRNHQHCSVRMQAIPQAILHKSRLKKVIIGLLSASLVLFVLVDRVHAADVNPYASNYKEQNTSQLKSMEADPDTKIYVSNHKDDDNISMLESGYDMSGVKFNAFASWVCV